MGRRRFLMFPHSHAWDTSGVFFAAWSGPSEPSGWARVNHKLAHYISGQIDGFLPMTGGQACYQAVVVVSKAASTAFATAAVPSGPPNSRGLIPPAKVRSTAASMRWAAAVAGA